MKPIELDEEANIEILKDGAPPDQYSAIYERNHKPTEEDVKV